MGRMNSNLDEPTFIGNRLFKNIRLQSNIVSIVPARPEAYSNVPFVEIKLIPSRKGAVIVVEIK